jgi:uncharacterized protein YjiS (DUF1127 family)
VCENEKLWIMEMCRFIRDYMQRRESRNELKEEKKTREKNLQALRMKYLQENKLN